MKNSRDSKPTKDSTLQLKVGTASEETSSPKKIRCRVRGEAAHATNHQADADQLHGECQLTAMRVTISGKRRETRSLQR